MPKKKNPAACDGWALKANSKNLRSSLSAFAFRSQLIFLQRRFGLPPLRLWPARADLFARKRDHNRAEAALIARYGAERIVNCGGGQ